MKVGILGDGLTSLALAKMLVNKSIYVDLLAEDKVTNYSQSRTFGITKKNFDFFTHKILDIKKISWKLSNIEIYTENLPNQKILEFKKKKSEIFSIIRNHQLYKNLNIELKKNKFFNKKLYKNNDVSIINQYDLVFNCNKNHLITKKFFSKKIEKKYNSVAHTAIIKHKKIDNKSAVQIFTKIGPIAFLPISNFETSIVYSVNTSDRVDLETLIKKYNTKYSILKILDKNSFELGSSNLRKYFYENILCFGDLIHKIHPLAGQGFNMTIRDIIDLSNIIDEKIELGLELNSSIFEEFEKKTKHRNFIFSQGIDLIYNFFDQERKINGKLISNSLKYFGKNKYFKEIFSKFADEGLPL
jgi:2-octaprenyl-6-methoxyphenol hydroxylase